MSIKYIKEMTYSDDLRTKALKHIAKGVSKVETSRIFGISIPTLFNWIKRKKKGCLGSDKKRKKTPHKIDGEKLRAYIRENPDSYLREIGEFFGTSAVAVFKACKRLKITLKKRPHSIKKGMRKKRGISKKVRKNSRRK